MSERIPQPCPKCGREKYFEGLCYWCGAEEERDQYIALSAEEVEEKRKYIAGHITEEDIFHNQFMPLFAYNGIDTSEIAKAAYDNDILYPYYIYRNAPAEVRDKMIERLKSDNEQQANALQCALSMIKDDNVVLESFLELENKPRQWRKRLHVDPSRYAEVGGWTFDKNGNRKELTFTYAYPLIKGDKSKDKAAIIGNIREEECPSCSAPLVDMLTIDGRDERLKFLGIAGIIKAKTCPNCCLYNFTFCKYTIDGESELMPFYERDDFFESENYWSDEDITELQNNSFVLGTEPVNEFFGCGDDITHMIGGMPDWVQDSEYLDCPCCNQKMKYFAQTHWDALGDLGEGTLFYQICTDCQIIGMVHQQT